MSQINLQEISKEYAVKRKLFSQDPAIQFAFYHFGELLAYAEQLEAQKTWQPIESAPEDRVILTCRKGAGWVNFTWWTKVGYWKTHFGSCDPTHWMPLPEPPIDSQPA